MFPEPSTSQIPSTAFSPNSSITRPKQRESRAYPGFSGLSSAPLDYRGSARNKAIQQTFGTFLLDSPERLWWTVKDLAEGQPPWWRANGRWREEWSDSRTGRGKLKSEVENLGEKRNSAMSNTLNVFSPSRSKHHRHPLLPLTLTLPPRFPGYATLKPTTPVIMLGGFRGSILETDPTPSQPTPTKVWPNVTSAIISSESPDIAMLLSSDPAEAANGVRGVRMVNMIAGLCGIGWGLRRRLERLERDGRIRSTMRWGYDFRASLAESSKLLIKQATAVRDSHPSREGVTVFAHSMGGLVTAHAVATCEDPTIFAKVVYFGVPWEGCAGVFGPFRGGDGFLRQRGVCDAATGTSWPASFHLLPTAPAFFDTTGGPIPVDLTSVSDWDKFGLSPLAAGISSTASDSAANALTRHNAQDVIAAENGPASPTVPLSPTMSENSGSTGAPRSVNGSLASKGPLHPANASASTIKAHFERSLFSVLKFKSDLINGYSPEKAAAGLYPPTVIIAARNATTVKGAVFSEPTAEKVREEGYGNLVHGWGDGVVLWESAVGIPGVGVKKWLK